MYDGKTAFVTQHDSFATTDKEGVGRYRTIRRPTGATGGQGVGTFLWVLNSSGSAFVAGNVYSHGTAGFTLTTGTNASTFLEEVFQLGQGGKGTAIDMMAGVAVAATPSGSYGWVQVYGYCSVINMNAGTAIAVGDPLKMVSGQVYVVRDAGAGTAPSNGRHIISLSTVASGTSTNAGFIRCL